MKIIPTKLFIISGLMILLFYREKFLEINVQARKNAFC